MKRRRPNSLRRRTVLQLEHLEIRATPATGFTPAQIRHAYGIDQLSSTGAGQTIAIVDAYNDPNLASDLNTFDQQSGLSSYGSASSFLTVDAPEGRTANNAGWSQEIALDIEWSHAAAPGAKIVLVEAKSDGLSDLLSAVDYAAQHTGASVVSMSWGSSEFSSETSLDSHFNVPGVTFVAASGDNGTPIWPAVSPNVVAVGGTALTLNGSGGIASQPAWSDSGGGVSRYESKPAFQSAVLSGSRRGSPDVALDANPNTGYAVYDTYGGNGWYEIGGTSAGAPQWAGLIALVDQGRAAAGKTSLSSSATLSALYSLPSTDFNDVTSGGNRGNRAGAGYDLVTGLGSPAANRLVPDLVAGVTGSSSSSNGTSSGNSGTTTGSGSNSGTTGTSGGGFFFGFGFGFGFNFPFGFFVGRMATTAPAAGMSMTNSAGFTTMPAMPFVSSMVSTPTMSARVDQSAGRTQSSDFSTAVTSLRSMADAAAWPRSDSGGDGSADQAGGVGTFDDDDGGECGGVTPADGGE